MVTILGYVHASDYPMLISQLLAKGEDASPRGKSTIEVRPAVVKSTNLAFPFPLCTSRKLNIAFAFAEFLWILGGSSSLRLISQFNPRMADYSDDGTTLYGAYGPRIDLSRIISILRKDESTRQAVNVIFGNIDPLMESKDVPCTISLQFMLRNFGPKLGLSMTVNMRSNDAIIGFPYDWATFEFLGRYIANQLGTDLMEHVHIANSFHVYDHDMQLAHKIASDKIGETNAQFSPNFSRDKEVWLVHDAFEAIANAIERNNFGLINEIKPDIISDAGLRDMVYVMLVYAKRRLKYFEDISQVAARVTNDTIRKLVINYHYPSPKEAK